MIMKRSWPAVATVLGVSTALLLGCDVAPVSEDSGAQGDAALADAGRRVVDVSAGPVIGVGARSSYATVSERASSGQAGRFGFGRSANDAEIARMDIDVGPDGVGLPPGSGSPARGAEVYQVRCSYCHGVEAEGGVNERLIGEGGRTVSHYWPYATTLFDYMRRAMPFDNPGSLTDQEVYDVTAWLLYRSGLIGEDDTIDATSLPQVVMPGRAAFVPDDRERFQRVR